MELPVSLGAPPSAGPAWSMLIRDVPDFPSPGVLFKDVTPWLADGAAFSSAIDTLARHFSARAVDVVVGVEARGFIVASPVALALRTGFVPARKPGKLPWRVATREYSLEYGSGSLEIHEDAIRPGDRVVIVDDVLATGGTAGAAIALVEQLGGEVTGLGFLLELAHLGGRARLGDLDICALEVV